MRHPGETFVPRSENEWPLKRSQWTKFYLQPEGHTLASEAPKGADTVTYAGLSDGVTFLTPPLEQETEITGPIAAKLWVSSATRTPTCSRSCACSRPTWPRSRSRARSTRAPRSHRAGCAPRTASSDTKLSLPYRPYHTHDEIQKLKPGEVYELHIEVWPTCIVVPKGYRVALTVRGRDYEHPGGPSAA